MTSRQDNRYEVVVDIGGTGTKFGYRTIEGPKPRSFDDFKEESKKLFDDPEKVVDKLLDLFEEKSGVKVEQIDTMVFSITGDIDTVNGKIISSDRLAEFSKTDDKYEGFEWVKRFKEKLPESCNIHALHDGFAYAYAAAFQSHKMPLMVVTLGTAPAVSVFHISDEKISIFSCESFTKVLIYHVGGTKDPLCDILSKHDIKDMKENAESDKIFTRDLSSRLNVAVKEFLTEFNEVFGEQPGAIIFSGGNSNHLDINIVQADIPMPIEFMKNEDQKENMFLGCLDYAKRHSIVSLFKV
jgi:hypothetical protein